MAKRIKADHDTWTATLDTSASGTGHTVVFFCASNGQRAWRVVRAYEDDIPAGDLDALSASELRALFDRSGSMNVLPS